MKITELSVRPHNYLAAFRKRMAEAGVSQRYLASCMEPAMDDTQLSRYFSGRVNDPHLSMVVRLEKALDKAINSARIRKLTA